MVKLTLDLDDDVIATAKRIAKESGTNVSAVFARWVRAMVLSAEERKKGKTTRCSSPSAKS